MSEKRASEPNIPEELRQELDAMLVEYMDHSERLRELKHQAMVKTSELRLAVAATFRKSETQEKKIKEKRAAIAARFTKVWEERFPEVTCAILPSARVARVTRRTITVKNKRALLEKLDRLDRLDLVDQVIDESGLLKLSRTGALDDLPEDVIVIKDAPEIQVRHREED